MKLVNKYKNMKEERKKEKKFIQIKNIWDYNVYILKLNLSINYSDWKWMVEFLRKLENSLTKIARFISILINKSINLL